MYLSSLFFLSNVSSRRMWRTTLFYRSHKNVTARNLMKCVNRNTIYQSIDPSNYKVCQQVLLLQSLELKSISSQKCEDAIRSEKPAEMRGMLFDLVGFGDFNL
jgi:hypothetical protein